MAILWVFGSRQRYTGRNGAECPTLQGASCLAAVVSAVLGLVPLRLWRWEK